MKHREWTPAEWKSRKVEFPEDPAADEAAFWKWCEWMIEPGFALFARHGKPWNRDSAVAKQEREAIRETS